MDGIILVIFKAILSLLSVLLTVGLSVIGVIFVLIIASMTLPMYETTATNLCLSVPVNVSPGCRAERKRIAKSDER